MEPKTKKKVALLFSSALSSTKLRRATPRTADRSASRATIPSLWLMHG